MRKRPVAHRPSQRVVPPIKGLTYYVGTGLWLTGVLWLVFHNFLQTQTDFGLRPHPLEFWWRAAHGFFAFAALWSFGLLYGAHIAKAWHARRYRASGGVLLGMIVWMCLSGYLLYYLGNDKMHAAVLLLHWGVGVTLPIAFLVHRILRSSSKSARP